MIPQHDFLGFSNEQGLIQTTDSLEILVTGVIVDDSDNILETTIGVLETQEPKAFVETCSEVILDDDQNSLSTSATDTQIIIDKFVDKNIYERTVPILKHYDITLAQSLALALHAFLVRSNDDKDQMVYTVYEFREEEFTENYLLKMESFLPKTFDLLVQGLEPVEVKLLESWRRTPSFQELDLSNPLGFIATESVALEFYEVADKTLSIRLVSPKATYDIEERERFADNFVAFWLKAVADPHQPLLDLPLCGDEELQIQRHFYWSSHTTPNTWNNTTVIDRIFQTAQEYPQATAVITSDGKTLSYNQLVQRASIIAASLQQSGAHPGDLIGLLAPPGLDEIAGMLAIVLSRCGYMAMDPSFATKRLSYMVTDSQTPIILVSTILEDCGLEVVRKSQSSPKILLFPESYEGSSNFTLLPPSPQDPFYTIYTSGSTGSPKGLVLTQSNTQQMLSTLHNDYKFSRFDRFLHHSSMSFDLSVVEIFSALTCGATICVASAQTKRDPEALGDFMKQVSITVTYFTPTKFALLLEACQESLQQCQEYRVAFFAGERLPARVAAQFYALKLRATMYNTWSPSELVVQTCIHKVPRDTVQSKTNIPIGFPMANCGHYVVDSNLNPVPIGVVGEICVGGAQVGRGYLNQTGGKSQGFIHNPFASDEYIKNGWTRLFRTGDKGRFLPNGELEFHGRIAGDKQIKLRGLRIDLGEIEQRLFEASKAVNGLTRLTDVNVFARCIKSQNLKEESMTDDRQLIAFLVPRCHLENSERQLYVDVLHHELRTHLNEYMLPNGYEILDILPMTIGGKVDIQHLKNCHLTLLFPSIKAPDQVDDVSTKEFDCEVDPIVSTITDLFRDLLSLPDDRHISPGESFFALGGQSMLVLQLQAQLRGVFQVKLPLSIIFKDATPVAIAKMVRDKQASLQKKSPTVAILEQDQIDWKVEIKLPQREEFLAPRNSRRRPRSEISTILVTGAETFIGIHFISTILTRAPRTTIYILGTSHAMTLEELRTNLGKYQLLNDAWSDLAQRVIPIAGALNEPQFGLSQQQFSALGQDVHAIYHMGGEVSLLKSYYDLKPANVLSTLTLISLAHHGSYLTEVHYLSTWSIPHLQGWHDTHLTKSSITSAEESADHFTPSTSPSQGYLKTRWAAEILLTRASERGFRVSIYRSSAVTASSVTNVPEPMYDLYRHTIMQMVQASCIPEDFGSSSSMPFAVDFIPVDYLVSTILALGASTRIDEGTMQSIYHIGNPSPLVVSDLVPLIPQVLQQENKDSTVNFLPFEEWLLTLGSGVAAGEELRIAAIKDLFLVGHVAFSLDRAKTAGALELIEEGNEQWKVAPCLPVGVEYLQGMINSSW